MGRERGLAQLPLPVCRGGHVLTEFNYGPGTSGRIYIARRPAPCQRHWWPAALGGLSLLLSRCSQQQLWEQNHKKVQGPGQVAQLEEAGLKFSLK